MKIHKLYHGVTGEYGGQWGGKLVELICIKGDLHGHVVTSTVFAQFSKFKVNIVSKYIETQLRLEWVIIHNLGWSLSLILKKKNLENTEDQFYAPSNCWHSNDIQSEN